MKPVSLLVALLLATSAFAAWSAESPLAGRWSLDVSTLPMPPEARPKSVDLEFRSLPDGKWSTDVDIIDAGNNRMSSASTLNLDGTPGRATGNYWVDVLSAKMPAPNVLVMQFVYQGIPRSTRIYSVSEDGNVLTETEAYFKEDATPVMRTALFNRAPHRP